jgi:high affinity sulfate transporter 1
MQEGLRRRLIAEGGEKRMKVDMGRFRSIVPILDWLPHYDKAFLKSDLMAGLTVGMVVIPAAMGYASLAGLPTQYGLYAAVVSLIAYCIFGSSKHLIVVPSSGPAALVGAGLMGLAFANSNQYVAAVAMLAFLAGLLLIFARVVRMGFVVNFISETVLLGFQIGLALYVIALQLGKVLGISGATGNFIPLLVYYAQHITEANLATIALALAGFAFLLLGKKVFKKLPLKFLLIILATVGVILLPLVDKGIAVVGPIPDGLPAFVLPSTGGQSLDALLTIAVGLFLITLIEGVSIGRTFAKRGGYELDCDQELLAYGAANASASFFQGMPVDGSASNTGINFDSGAKTQLAGGFAAAIVVLVLLFFASFFSNLPVVIIGVIIITSMVVLLDFKTLSLVFRYDRVEFAFAMVALVGVLLFGLLEGIFLGVALTLLVLLYRLSKPTLTQLGRIPGTTEYSALDRSPENEVTPGIIVLRVESPILFPNATRVRQEVKRMVREKGGVKLVVLTLRASSNIDLQGVSMLSNLHDELKATGAELRLAEVHGGARNALKHEDLEQKFGKLEPGMSVQRVIDEWARERKP